MKSPRTPAFVLLAVVAPAAFISCGGSGTGGGQLDLERR